MKYLLLALLLLGCSEESRVVDLWREQANACISAMVCVDGDYARIGFQCQIYKGYNKTLCPSDMSPSWERACKKHKYIISRNEIKNFPIEEAPVWAKACMELKK